MFNNHFIRLTRLLLSQPAADERLLKSVVIGEVIGNSKLSWFFDSRFSVIQKNNA